MTSGWNRDNRGWWYRFSNGSYAKNTWQLINGKWYFFGEDGYMRTGWILWNGVYYYCGPDGAMFTNCYTPDGYYVDGNGAWVQRTTRCLFRNTLESRPGVDQTG